MYTLEINIPHLPKLPNTLLGAHWRVRSGHARKWKQMVALFTGFNKPTKPLSRAALTLTRNSSRRPDFDGLAGSFKPIIDGLVVCGVLVDDTHEVIGTPNYQWKKSAPKKGCVEILVEEL